MMLHHPVRYRTRTIRRSRHRSLTLVLFAATLATSLSAGSAQSQEKLAEITGGVDETRQNYYWTVVNNYSSPIVHVEFPHHRADRFQIIPSTGWEQECTYLVNVGVPDKPGVCIAKAKAPNPGIPPGARHDFSMG
ncbi:MAG: hypothetical protein GX616_12995, partial [Planctomycetes bacterium]|nr:hypothetical protein [Planctomycetota bacterium]